MNLDMTNLLLEIFFLIPWWAYFLIVFMIYFIRKINYFVHKEQYKDIQNREKGAKYEDYVSRYFKNLGYEIVEYGKIHGVKDQGIDLMLKKEKEFIFVQCKDWNIKNRFRIDSKEIQYTRMNVRDYIENHKELFTMYEWKIFYITSDNILNRSAKYKIQEHNEEIEHIIIPI